MVKPLAEQRDCVVVGAGLGGLICAAVLSGEGRAPLVVEEGPMIGQPGGATQYRGHWIDWSHRDCTGGRDTLMVTGPRFHEAVERTGAVVEMVRLPNPPVRAHVLPDRHVAALGSADFAETVLGLKPDMLNRYAQVMGELRRIPEEEVARLRSVTFGQWLESVPEQEVRRAVLTMNTIGYFIPPEQQSVGRYVERNLRAAAGASSSGGAFMAADHEVGGMQGFMEPFARIIRERGGDIWTDHKPLELIVVDGRVEGLLVRNANGFVREVRTRTVVYNPPAYKVLELVPGNLLPAAWVARANSTKPYEKPSLGAYLALREAPRIRSEGEQDDFAGWNRVLLGEDRRYGGGWCIPSLSSPRAAPDGRHLLQAMNGGVGDYHSLLPDLEDLVEYIHEYYDGLEAITEWTEVQYQLAPSGYGWVLAGPDRVGVESPIDGLLFAGSTTEGPGHYQETEASAALDAADIALARSVAR